VNIALATVVISILKIKTFKLNAIKYKLLILGNRGDPKCYLLGSILLSLFPNGDRFTLEKKLTGLS